MKEIQVEHRPLDFSQYKLRSALESDYSTLITESCIVKEGDKVLLIYQELDFNSSDMIRALQRIKYQKSTRTSGLVTTSRIFGYAPRNALRNDYCRLTSFAKEQPKEHAVICDYARKVAQLYRKNTPETYEKHDKVTGEVLDEYRIPGTPFTSGIVNKNNPLKYHHDAGNFKKVYSCMLVYKYYTGGGHLALPEYDIGIELKNNSLFMFDGQEILHGVTPIRKLSTYGFRYSIVYYSLERMWDCLPVTDEVVRIRNQKTKIEERRLQSIKSKT